MANLPDGETTETLLEHYRNLVDSLLWRLVFSEPAAETWDMRSHFIKLAPEANEPGMGVFHEGTDLAVWDFEQHGGKAANVLRVMAAEEWLAIVGDDAHFDDELKRRYRDVITRRGEP